VVLLLVAAIAGCLMWLFVPVGKDLIVQWLTTPDASYGVIVAIIATMMFWHRRRQIVTSGSCSGLSWIGALVITGGLAAYLAGIFAADLFTTRASIVVVGGGLVWFLAGTGPASAAFAPLMFLLLAIPLPELVVTVLTSSLQTVAARIAEFALVTGGIAVYRDGNVLELPATTLQIVEACSGLRSVVSLASVGIVLAWAADGPVHRRALITIFTVPIAVLANGLRVAAAGASSEVWGPVVMRDPWHSLAGWVTFVVSLMALWVVRRAVLRKQRNGTASSIQQVART
jgi:exosortase